MEEMLVQEQHMVIGTMNNTRKVQEKFIFLKISFLIAQETVMLFKTHIIMIPYKFFVVIQYKSDDFGAHESYLHLFEACKLQFIIIAWKRKERVAHLCFSPSHSHRFRTT